MDIQIPDPIREQCERKGGVKGIRKRLPSKAALKKHGKAFRAVSEPVRATILLALVEQPLCVCLLKELAGIPDSKLSYHINVLKEAGLIKGRRQGSWIIYHATEKGKKLAELVKEF
jgi:DNA-binding transcriptional ArsR family regulator